MTHYNTIFWAIGLLLQLLLLASLFLSAAARRLPLFTALIAFFLIRSILLFSLFGHIAPETYVLTNNTLSLLDLALQIAVAWELFRASHPRASYSGPALRPVATFTSFALLAAASAWELSRLLPVNVRYPVDRGVLFAAILLLAVSFTTTWTRLLPTQRRALQGLAALSLVAILAQVGRTLAIHQRNALAFHRWSYAEPIAYVLVLLFWLLTMRGGPLLLQASGPSSTLPPEPTLAHPMPR